MASDEKLKLQTNIAETIALEFDRGLPVSGIYGDQVLFTLTDGRKWYAPPFVAAKVEAAGYPAGVFFTITKREIVDGNRRRVEYQISDAVTSAAPVAAVPVKSETATVVKTAAAPKQSNLASIQLAQTQHTAVAPAAAPAASLPAACDSSSVALMKIAACGAIDVILEAERYAQARGLVDFAFNPDSIQDLVSTLFIAMDRKSGRAA